VSVALQILMTCTCVASSQHVTHDSGRGGRPLRRAHGCCQADHVFAGCCAAVGSPRKTPEQACTARDSVGALHVVINHLRLREPVPDATVEAARKGMQLVVDAGALAARVAKVDETHLILILEFSTAEDADRIAREVGGPWMRENIRPLLAGDTERSVAEVIASAGA
jgi:hypothetical protein